MAHEEMFNIPGHKGSENQTTSRFYLILIRMDTIKNKKQMLAKKPGKMQYLYTFGGNVN
jgi:hypothetical protein